MKTFIDSRRKPEAIQKIINRAQPGDILDFSQAGTLKLSEPLEVHQRDITIQKLRAKCAKKGKPNELLVVFPVADNFKLFDCHFQGRSDYDDNRKPFVAIYSNNVHVNDVRGVKGSKDCILISAEYKNITSGLVEKIRGHKMGRDTVSLEGHGEADRYVSGIVVDDVYCNKSKYKGAVESSDGSYDNTIRNVYCKDSGYAVDVQDHGKGKGQTNKQITIEDCRARDCENLVRTANNDYDHCDLFIQHCTAEDCEMPLMLKNTRCIFLDHVNINQKRYKDDCVYLENCSEVTYNQIRVNGDDFDSKLHLKEK